MDALYILGTGSLADNNEIRYSLRSLDTFMLDLRFVHISGELPDFVQGIIHTPSKDRYKKPWQNMLHKVRAACEREDLTDEFLLMNDDFFLLEHFTGADYPFEYRKHIDGGPSGPRAYILHKPMRMHKKLILEMPLTPEMGGDFRPRSFFGNFYGVGGSPQEDCIVISGTSAPPFEKQIAGQQSFSIDDVTMTDPAFYEFLHDLYPDKSRFEKVPENKIYL